jgi:hypothetical protein
MIEVKNLATVGINKIEVREYNHTYNSAEGLRNRFLCHELLRTLVQILRPFIKVHYTHYNLILLTVQRQK